MSLPYIPMDSTLFRPPYRPSTPPTPAYRHCQCCDEEDVCVCDCRTCDCRYADTPEE